MILVATGIQYQTSVFLVNGKQLIWIEPDQLHGLMDDQNHGLLSKARNITFTLQMYIPTDDGQQH